jgi:hypothetical protein
MLQGVTNQVPVTADMLYLEFCFETCQQLRYSHRHSNRHSDRYCATPLLARAYAPSCSAAILFTAKGAARIAELTLPVFDVIDRMYQSLIVSGLVEAYVATPPIFYQVDPKPQTLNPKPQTLNPEP